MKNLFLLKIIMILFVLLFSRNLLANEIACKELGKIDFTNILDAPTKITGTRHVKASKDIPSYCDVIGYSAPQVGLQIRLPDDWNGRFHMEGCGTLCGVRIIENATDMLLEGTAISTTDMGHSAPVADSQWTGDSPNYNVIMRSGIWAYNNIEQEIDYAYRGTHKAVLASKEIISRYYSSDIDFSYFRGCSTGGRQGLILAQRYPWHFDGIISGAPAGIGPAYINIFWRTLANLNSEGRSILGKKQILLLHKLVMNKCDNIDGLKDGVISDPWGCKIDFEAYKCNSNSDQDCFTNTQIKVIQLLYKGAFLSNNTRASWGVPKGGELGLMRYISKEAGEIGTFETLAQDRLRYTWFDYDPGPSYDVRSFNLDRDFPRLFTKGFLQAPNNPDLSGFELNGGKLILYQGLNDMLNTEPLINYVKKVQNVVGNKENADKFIRLYLIPGMNHCRGGPGVDSFDWFKAIKNWVEGNKTPAKLIGYRIDDGDASPASRSWPIKDEKKILFSRPIYNYPYVPNYSGSGEIKSSDNFRPKPVSF